MQLTLAAGFAPFSRVLNTVLVLSVLRGRPASSCGRAAGRTESRGGSAAEQVGPRAAYTAASGGEAARLPAASGGPPHTHTLFRRSPKKGGVTLGDAELRWVRGGRG